MTFHPKRLLVGTLVMVSSMASAAITFFMAPLWGLMVLSSLLFVGFYLCLTAFTGDPAACDKCEELRYLTWQIKKQQSKKEKEKDQTEEASASEEQRETDIEAHPQTSATAGSQV